MGTGQNPIVRMTAKEFMFGYETSLTTIGNKVFPNWIKFDRVGLIDRVIYTIIEICGFVPY